MASDHAVLYSWVSNKRTVGNKRTGGPIKLKLINVQDEINVQGKIGYSEIHWNQCLCLGWDVQFEQKVMPHAFQNE